MLNQGQQKALDAFLQFMSDPKEQVFILEGPAGTGKSYLLQHLLDAIPKHQQAINLLDPNAKSLNVLVTATTNKAVDALSQFVPDVCTIHSALGLKVDTDITSGKTSLSVRRGAQTIENTLICIDEASFIDNQLLNLLFSRTYKCKYLLMGDPYQLTPVKATSCPAFQLQAQRAELTEIVRNKGNQIEEVSKLLKNAVRTGVLDKFTPDNKAMFLLTGPEFKDAITKEFSDPDWNESKAKIIAWTNASVIQYGNYVSGLLNGVPHFVAGNYATVNSYITHRSGRSYKTDETVCISSINSKTEHGVNGFNVVINHSHDFFLPANPKDIDRTINAFRKASNYVEVANIQNHWIDLRPAPACTINKSQGSTYERVYIDYDDILKCRQQDLLFRLLYVAVSRAKTHVYFKRSNK